MKINELLNEDPQIGDQVDLIFGDILIESAITAVVDGGIVVDLDSKAMGLIMEAKRGLLETGAPAPHRLNPEPSWALDEAEYRGRKVPLGKPMRGDVKKFKVYVKGPKGNVVKVNFGDPNMRIKKSIPARRKSFRARHRCSTPGPRWKARYWSCRAW